MYSAIASVSTETVSYKQMEVQQSEHPMQVVSVVVTLKHELNMLFPRVCSII